MYENLDLDNIITPVNAAELENLLQETQYDKQKTKYLIQGFKEGFRLGYEGQRTDIKRNAPNLKLNIGTKTDLWNKVMKEVEKKRYAGPFTKVPFSNYIQSPIGLVPKDNGKDTRLIFHLSYPRSGKSVNSETPKDLCKVKYPDFSQAVKLCMLSGQGKAAFSGKSDFKSAFRNLPMSKTDFMLLVMIAENPIDHKIYYFVDKCLPFGASISCAIFQAFSDAVAHIFRKITGKDTVNYLDDYYFVALWKALCDWQIREFLRICEIIKFPVSMDKTVWGCTVITFLGFLIDSINQVIAIPVDKVERAKVIINRVLNKSSKKLTLHELQKICGFLNHLCRAIVPGRAFTRRLYAYTAGTLLPHHHINIKKEMRQDLNMWLKFLENPIVYSRPFMDYNNVLYPEDLDWYTDASKNPKLGFGGNFGHFWFAKKWSDDNEEPGNFIIDKDPSIQYLELFAVTASVLLWIHKVRNKRIRLYCDNKSVVDMINMNTSSCKNCMVLIRILVLESMKNNVRIYAKHVTSEDNAIADALSRFQFSRLQTELEKRHKELQMFGEEIPDEIWPVRKIWIN